MKILRLSIFAILVALIPQLCLSQTQLIVHLTDGKKDSFDIALIDSITFSLADTSMTQIPPDFIAYYPFNGNANDESGNGNDGELQGNATVTDILIIGDNSSDRLSLPHTIVDGIADFTFSARVKINVLHKTGSNPFRGNALISTANSSVDNVFAVGYVSNVGVWRYTFQQTHLDFNDTTVEDLNWHHIVVLRNSTTARLYLDGIEVGNGLTVTDTPLTIEMGGFIIGQEQDSLGGGFVADESWAGEIDNLRIYNRAISHTEVQIVFNIDGKN